MKKGFILSAVLFLLASFCGSSLKVANGFVLRKHEFSVSGAFFQHMYMDTPLLRQDDTALLSSVPLDEKERMTGNWKIAYAYNFTKVFALEVGLTYEGYKDNFYNSDTGRKTNAYYADILGVMATLRISWLNRRLVRVYSSCGVGYSCMFSGGNYSKSGGPVIRYDNTSRVDWQVAPVGMTIGGRLYGIVELGLGTVFVGGRFGVGYRF